MLFFCAAANKGSRLLCRNGVRARVSPEPSAAGTLAEGFGEAPALPLAGETRAPGGVVPRLRTGPYPGGVGRGSIFVIITVPPATVEGPALTERCWEDPGFALTAMARTGVPLTDSESVDCPKVAVLSEGYSTE